MATISTYYERICYGCQDKSQMNHLLDVEEEEEEESYLNYPGPFLELPSSLLEDLVSVLYDRRSLPKQMLHQLILPQLEVGLSLSPPPQSFYLAELLSQGPDLQAHPDQAPH